MAWCKIKEVTFEIVCDASSLQMSSLLLLDCNVYFLCYSSNWNCLLPIMKHSAIKMGFAYELHAHWKVSTCTHATTRNRPAPTHIPARIHFSMHAFLCVHRNAQSCSPHSTVSIYLWFKWTWQVRMLSCISSSYFIISALWWCKNFWHPWAFFC